MSEESLICIDIDDSFIEMEEMEDAFEKGIAKLINNMLPCRYCYKLIEREILTNHIKQHKVNNDIIFSCNNGRCKNSFTTWTELFRHETIFHRKVPKKEENLQTLFSQEQIPFEYQTIFDFITVDDYQYECCLIDFSIKKENVQILIEVDEFQHTNINYSLRNEIQRMLQVNKKLNDKVIWIRYNPDRYKVNGVFKQKPEIEKEFILLNTITNITKYLQYKYIYLFYDTISIKDENKLIISFHPDFTIDNYYCLI